MNLTLVEQINVGGTKCVRCLDEKGFSWLVPELVFKKFQRPGFLKFPDDVLRKINSIWNEGTYATMSDVERSDVMKRLANACGVKLSSGDIEI